VLLAQVLVVLAVFVAGSSRVAEALAAADSTVLQVNPWLIMAPAHTSLQAMRAVEDVQRAGNRRISISVVSLKFR